MQQFYDESRPLSDEQGVILWQKKNPASVPIQPAIVALKKEASIAVSTVRTQRNQV